MCVIMTSNKVGRIIADLQTGGGSADDAEARKIYVAASRAKRLLVLAVPKKISAPKREALLAANGCTAQRHDI